jgi:TolB-like protein
VLPEIKDNQLAILETIRNIPVSELPKMNKEKPEAYAAFLKATDNEIAAFNARVNTIKSLRVPPALVPFHKSFLQYLRGMQQQYRLARGITKDPVQGLISIQVLYVLANETSAELADSFTHQISTAFQ